MESLRVLIADDNQDAADTLAVLCRVWGHAACVAYEGPTALGLAGRFEPQVFLLDSRMPGMHGGQVAERLRSDPRFQRSVIYATSANAPTECQLRSWLQWFDGFLLKPYNLVDLESFLATWASCRA